MILRLLLRYLLLTCVVFGSVVTAYAGDENNTRDHWAETLMLTSNSVVALEISRVRPFDFSEQGISTATGFVVDAEKGIILTNRHVVGSGPMTATATFQNQERVEVVPLYRDTVHDFGFLRYDPGDLDFIKPQALHLRPDKATTGLDIRVLGSDGGEQLSILAGTIARLDRPVPNYGRYGYNDFNTFYMQAASSTSGGSSGSPVIDIDGDVVALNAAANTNTASSFFLPLDRVVHALKLLREGKSIKRGTLQTLFDHRPFRSLRRIGLNRTEENTIRDAQPGINGMLVVGQVITAGVASEKLSEGDILLSIDDQTITDFVSLESLLDSRVGESVAVRVQRQGKNRIFNLQVADFHALQATSLVELGGAVLHDMTLQASRATNKPQRGVLMADRGYMFTRANVPPGAVITEINGHRIDDIADFIDMLRASADGDNWLIRYYLARREFTSELSRVEVDRRWFEARHCTRRDDYPQWPCETIEVAGPEKKLARSKHIDLPEYSKPLSKKIAPALVSVSFDIPHPLDNVYARHFSGTGLVIDATAGLVAVDRNTAPITLGDARLTFFESVEVLAHVAFVHPLHNVALLKYDPSELGDIEIEPVVLAQGDLRVDNRTFSMIGFKPNRSLLQHRIDNVTSQTLNFDLPRLPRYQQSTIDVYSVPNMPNTIGGAISDEAGNVVSMWSSFSYPGKKTVAEGEWALPAEVIDEALQLYRSGKPLRLLGASLGYMPLANARQLGLPDEWLQRIAMQREQSLAGRRVLVVRQLSGHQLSAVGGQTETGLRVGDLLLAIDDVPVAGLRDVEKRIQKDRVRFTLLRNGQTRSVELETGIADNKGTLRVLSWAGAYLQQPHREISAQRGLPADGIYVSSTVRGSPANRDGLYRNRLITAVDGNTVNDLDDFLRYVADKKPGQDTRLTLVSLNGSRDLVSVRPEYNFWPTFELIDKGDGWRRFTH